MESTPRRSASRRVLSNGLRAGLFRGKQAAAALVLLGSVLVAGPDTSAAAAAPPVSMRPTVTAPDSSVTIGSERVLAARLAVEYAGAVPAVEVESLVHGVSRQLRRDASPPERLLRTVEAVCRSALTDHLARGTRLYVA